MVIKCEYGKKSCKATWQSISATTNFCLLEVRCTLFSDLLSLLPSLPLRSSAWALLPKSLLLLLPLLLWHCCSFLSSSDASSAAPDFTAHALPQSFRGQSTRQKSGIVARHTYGNIPAVARAFRHVITLFFPCLCVLEQFGEVDGKGGRREWGQDWVRSGADDIMDVYLPMLKRREFMRWKAVQKNIAGMRLASKSMKKPTVRSKMKPNQCTMKKSVCSVDRNSLRFVMR